jgi:hypothetical protein
MPKVLTQASTILCPHEGVVMVIPADPMVQAVGPPVLTMADETSVAGCTNMLGEAPNPCMRVIWTEPAVETLVGGVPVLTKDSVGLCITLLGIPGGEASIEDTQPEVGGE